MLCRISDIRIVAVLGAIAVLAVWAIANTDHVEVDWAADTTTAPLIVAIGAHGFIIGLFLTWRHRSCRFENLRSVPLNRERTSTATEPSAAGATPCQAKARAHNTSRDRPRAGR